MKIFNEINNNTYRMNQFCDNGKIQIDEIVQGSPASK